MFFAEDDIRRRISLIVSEKRSFETSSWKWRSEWKARLILKVFFDFSS